MNQKKARIGGLFQQILSRIRRLLRQYGLGRPDLYHGIQEQKGSSDYLNYRVFHVDPFRICHQNRGVVRHSILFRFCRPSFCIL